MVAQESTRREGFTLVELVVAIGIFGIFIVLLIGIFNRFIYVQRKDVGDLRLVEDVRFALELMNREMRTAYGSTYFPVQGGNGVLMRNQNGQCVHYEWIEEDGIGSMQRASTETGSCDSIDVFPNDAYAPLTSDEVDVERAFFDVEPATVTSEGELETQGFITITLNAQTQNEAVAPMDVQSTVTSRQFTPYEQ